MKKILAILLLAPFLACAAEEGGNVDPAPINLHDKVSLQRGAAIFVNNCLNCHSAGNMRYGRLQDLGLTEDQIRKNLIFTEAKVGDTMTATMDPKIAQAAFGVVPPDLSLVGRSRSPDCSTRTCAPSTATRTARRAGTTPSSRTSRCPTCSGTTRGSRCCR